MIHFWIWDVVEDAGGSRDAWGQMRGGELGRGRDKRGAVGSSHVVGWIGELPRLTYHRCWRCMAIMLMFQGFLRHLCAFFGMVP